MVNRWIRRTTATKFTTAAAAVVTATALTAGLGAPVADAAVGSPAVIAERNAEVQLAALQDSLGGLITRWKQAAYTNQSVTDPPPGFAKMPLAQRPVLGAAPDPAAIPDLTLGLGRRVADVAQKVGIAGAEVVPGRVNLGPVWEAFGLNPNAAISDLLGAVLTGVVTNMPLPAELPALIAPFLAAADITTVGQLLDLINFSLTDPLNIHGGSPGLNIVTSGPLFTLGKALGIDAGWAPMFPDAIAEAANATTPLNIDPVAVVNELNNQIPSRPIVPNQALKLALTTAAATLSLAGLTSVDAKIPVVVGMGPGAFAAGEAYPQIREAALASAADPTVTILVSALLANPGRANGGLFARFYPLAALAGINTITRDQQVGGAFPGSLFIPIKIDAGFEYSPLSDFPAWANPVSLANTAAATVLPTYLLSSDLRGTTVTTNPAAPTNVYATVPVSALPLLQPLALPVTVANIGLNAIAGVKLNNPAVTALQPVTESLVNLGYTDVRWDAASSTYTRTLDKGNVVTPFGSLPTDVSVRDLPGNLIKSLQVGVSKAWNDGLITTGGGSSPLALTTRTQLIAKDGTPTLTAGSLGSGKLIKELTALVPTKNGLTQLTGSKLQLSTGSSARKTPVKDALTTTGRDLNAVGTQVRTEVKKAVAQVKAQVDNATGSLKPKTRPKAKAAE